MVISNNYLYFVFFKSLILKTLWIHDFYDFARYILFWVVGWLYGLPSMFTAVRQSEFK